MSVPNLSEYQACTGSLASAWAAGILNALDAPINEANVYSFAGWFAREGGGGENNPMNTTLGSQYPSVPNTPGVRNFPTSDIGIQETVATLSIGYPAIVADFKAGNGLAQPSAAAAAELGKWSGGGYFAITPVVVPMPVIASMHYELYDTTHIVALNESEQRVVINYDIYRANPSRYHANLVTNHEHLAFLIKRLTSNIAASGNDTYNRKWRLAQLVTRYDGKIAKSS
jgi:hypothetical protein